MQELARKRTVQVLVGFGLLTGIGYYMWLKKKKDALRWANYGGGNMEGFRK